MRKFYTVLLLVALVTFSEASINEEKNVDILAKSVTTEENIVTAQGNVVAFSINFYITADKMFYYKEKGTLEFFGDVSVTRANTETTFSEYLFVDLDKEMQNSKPVVLIDQMSKMWFSSKQIQSEQDKHNFDSTTFSSCDCKDPDWTVTFSSGDFDSKEQWVNMYNATLFIKDVPILYTPYFGFSTNRTRRSGLLPPTIGISSEEGLVYAQPIYYAPAIDYDIEYIPQIRTNRGHGHTVKYRFVDSIYSSLHMEGGVFYENDSYYASEQLTNKKHYGWNIAYNRTKLFSNEDHQDGLKLYAVDMNDVDYANTQHDDDSSKYDDRYLNSYIKYFYNTNKYFGSIEARKYEDLAADTYGTTLQTRPVIKLHKYTDTLFSNNITYSITAQMDRQERDQGIGANTFSLSAPLIYTYSFLDNYLDISFGTVLDYLHMDYMNNTQNFDDPNFMTATNFVELGTNLIKPYENFVHSLQFATKYENPHTIVKNGDLYSLTTNDPNLSDFTVSRNNKQLSFFMNQSFANNDFETFLDHSITQNWVYNDQSESYKKGDLEHDLIVYYGDSTLSNRFYFNHELNTIVQSTTVFSYDDKKRYVRLYYNFSKDENNNWKNQEDFIYQLGYYFDRYYSIGYGEEYDLTANTNKRREITFNIDKKCWAVRFKLVDSLIATDAINKDSKRQNIFYVELSLKEFLNFNQQFNFD